MKPGDILLIVGCIGWICIFLYLGWGVLRKYNDIFAGFIVLLSIVSVGMLFQRWCQMTEQYRQADVAFIESIAFEALESGNYNMKELEISKNLAYPEDKLCKIENSDYTYEVENDNGKSKVVVVFHGGQEWNMGSLHP